MTVESTEQADQGADAADGTDCQIERCVGQTFALWGSYLPVFAVSDRSAAAYAGSCHYKDPAIERINLPAANVPFCLQDVSFFVREQYMYVGTDGAGAHDFT